MTDLQLSLVLSGLVMIFLIYGFNRWQEFRYKKKMTKAFAKHHQDVLLNTPKNMVRHGSGTLSERYEPAFVQEQESFSEPASLSESETFDSEKHPPAGGTQEKNNQPQQTIPFLFESSTLHQEELEEKGTIRQSQVTQDWSSHPQESFSSSSLRETDKSSQTHHVTRRLADVDRDASLNPDFYFIAEVYAQSPIEAATIPILSAAKRVRCIGLRADQHWEVVTDGSLGRYSELKIGLQLVDRQGPINAEDMSAFSQTIELFAEEQHAKVNFTPRLSKIEKAVELDQFCADTDVQVGLNIMADFPLSLEQIGLFAEQENMTLAGDGAFHFTDEHGNTLFSLTNQGEGKSFTPNFLGETRMISFVLSVPLVSNGGEAFDYMCELASVLSSLLGGVMVDDNQHLLSVEGLKCIRQEIIEIQNKMQKRGLIAGSMMARQLYG